jgi:hypothetical protein
MATEVKKNTWARFCKKFNVTNQYRPVTVSVRHRHENEVKVGHDVLFMGVSISKRGRFIDGLELFTAQYNPERLAEPVVSVKQPVRILVEKDADERDNAILIEGENGTVVKAVLAGVKSPQQYHAFVEKVAYAISERHGFTSGSDFENWLEAERKVKETELQFVQ